MPIERLLDLIVVLPRAGIGRMIAASVLRIAGGSYYCQPFFLPLLK
jgi:hypothetical protein